MVLLILIPLCLFLGLVSWSVSRLVGELVGETGWLELVGE